MRLFMFRKLMYVQKTVHAFAIYQSYEECNKKVTDMFKADECGVMQCIATDMDSANNIFGLYEQGRSATYINALPRDIYKNRNFEDSRWYEIYRADPDEMIYLGRRDDFKSAKSITDSLNSCIPDKSYVFKEICIARGN